MDKPELDIDPYLLVSGGSFPIGKKKKDKLSNDTVKFTPVSVSYLLNFWKDVKDGNIASDVVLYQLKEDKDDVRGGTTGSCSVKMKDEETLSLYIPYRKNGQPLVVSQEEAVEKAKPNWTTQDLVEFVILPLASPKQKCMVDIIDKKHVGKPFQGAFVSQARSCKFQDLLQSIVNYYEQRTKKMEIIPTDSLVVVDNKGKVVPVGSYHAAKKDINFDEEYVWLDMFSANQPHLCNLHPSEKVQKKRYENLTYGLHEAIVNFDERLIFFDSFENPTPITRAWCIWELYGICKNDMSLEIICTGQTMAALEGSFIRGNLKIIEMLSSLNPKDMYCFNAVDLKMITEAVEKLPGGFSQLKSTVTESIRRWMLSFANFLRHLRLERLKKQMVDKRVETIDELYEATDVLILFNIGTLLSSFGQDSISEKYCTTAVEIYEKARKNEKISSSWSFLPHAWTLLAGIYLESGRFDLAIDAYKRVAQFLEGDEDVGSKHGALAKIYNSLGAAYLVGKYYDLAISTLEKAQEEANKAFGEINSVAVDILTNRGLVLLEQGKDEEALAMFEKCLKASLEIHGENSIETAPIYVNLSNVCVNLHKFNESIAYSDKALALNVSVYGEVHARTARVYNNMAYCYEVAGYYKESKKYYDVCCLLYEECLPQTSETASVLFHAGLVESKLGLFKDAEDHLRKAKELYQAVPGNHDVEVGWCEKELENNSQAKKVKKGGIFKKLL